MKKLPLFFTLCLFFFQSYAQTTVCGKTLKDLQKPVKEFLTNYQNWFNAVHTELNPTDKTHLVKQKIDFFAPNVQLLDNLHHENQSLYWKKYWGFWLEKKDSTSNVSYQIDPEFSYDEKNKILIVNALEVWENINLPNQMLSKDSMQFVLFLDCKNPEPTYKIRATRKKRVESPLVRFEDEMHALLKYFGDGYMVLLDNRVDQEVAEQKEKELLATISEKDGKNVTVTTSKILGKNMFRKEQIKYETQKLPKYISALRGYGYTNVVQNITVYKVLQDIALILAKEIGAAAYAKNSWANPEVLAEFEPLDSGKWLRRMWYLQEFDGENSKEKYQRQRGIALKQVDFFVQPFDFSADSLLPPYMNSYQKSRLNKVYMGNTIIIGVCDPEHYEEIKRQFGYYGLQADNQEVTPEEKPTENLPPAANQPEPEPEKEPEQEIKKDMKSDAKGYVLKTDEKKAIENRLKFIINNKLKDFAALPYRYKDQVSNSFEQNVYQKEIDKWKKELANYFDEKGTYYNDLLPTDKEKNIDLERYLSTAITQFSNQKPLLMSIENLYITPKLTPEGLIKIQFTKRLWSGVYQHYEESKTEREINQTVNLVAYLKPAFRGNDTNRKMLVNQVKIMSIQCPDCKE